LSRVFSIDGLICLKHSAMPVQERVRRKHVALASRALPHLSARFDLRREAAVQGRSLPQIRKGIKLD